MVRPVLDRAATDLLRDVALAGAGALDARDAEVALAHLRDVVATEPEELVLGPVAARLRRRRQHAEGQERAVATLTSPRYYQLLDELHALLADPPLIGPAGPARPVLRKAVRRAGAAAPPAAETATGRGGRARPRCTRCARPPSGFGTPRAGLGVLGRRAEKLVTAMEEVQDVLGEGQDTSVTRALCLRLGIEAATAGISRLDVRPAARPGAGARNAERAFWEPGAVLAR